jgi:hypothetical protein
MPVTTASKFRQVADRLADAALAATGETPGEDDLAALVEAGMAGKAALEAASAAEIGPGVITKALEGLRQELEAVELAEFADAAPIEDVLRTVLHELRARREQADKHRVVVQSLTVAYRHVAYRLLKITEQAEATGTATSQRVAAPSRQAIERSILTLQDVGLSIPITEPGA